MIAKGLSNEEIQGAVCTSPKSLLYSKEKRLKNVSSFPIG